MVREKQLQELFDYIESAFDRTPYESTWIDELGGKHDVDVGYAYDWWEHCMKPELIRVFGESEKED